MAMIGLGAVLLLVVAGGLLAAGGTELYSLENDKGTELQLMSNDLELYPLDGPVNFNGIGKLGVVMGGFTLNGCGTNVLLVDEPEAAQSVVVKDLKAAGINAFAVDANALKVAGGLARANDPEGSCEVREKPSNPQPGIAAVLAKLQIDALLVLRETGSMSYPERCSLLGGCNGSASHAQLAATLFARDGHVAWNGGGFADASLKRPNPVTWALGISPSLEAVRVGAADRMVRDMLADTHK